MQYFKEQTLGKTVLMGRKTFEWFWGRPLKNRRNVILSRDTGYKPDGAEVVHTLEQALLLDVSGEELMVIGGEQIYPLLLPHADRLLLTEIEASFGEGDAYFPVFDRGIWQLISSRPGSGDEKSGVGYSLTSMSEVSRRDRSFLFSMSLLGDKVQMIVLILH